MCVLCACVHLGCMSFTTTVCSYVDQPSFASGRVCLSNMIDSIFGEAFRKPYVIPVVQRLLLGPQHDDAKHGGAKYVLRVWW